MGVAFIWSSFASPVPGFLATVDYSARLPTFMRTYNNARLKTGQAPAAKLLREEAVCGDIWSAT